MLVHRRVNPSIKFTGTHLCACGERYCESLVQEQNTMSPARTSMWIAQSGVERTNHEILLVASCCRNWDKLWPDGAIGWYADYFCLPTCTYRYLQSSYRRGVIYSAHPCNQASVMVSTPFNCFCAFLQLPCHINCHITVSLTVTFTFLSLSFISS